MVPELIVNYERDMNNTTPRSGHKILKNHNASPASYTNSYDCTKGTGQVRYNYPSGKRLNQNRLSKILKAVEFVTEVKVE